MQSSPFSRSLQLPRDIRIIRLIAGVHTPHRVEGRKRVDYEVECVAERLRLSGPQKLGTRPTSDTPYSVRVTVSSMMAVLNALPSP